MNYINEKVRNKAMDIYPVLKEGYEKLNSQLKMLYLNRQKISTRIEEARGDDDLAENAAYDTAREEQVLNEMKIAEVEDKLSRAKVFYPDQLPKNKVIFGVTVKLIDDNDKEMVYTIVSDEEADILERKISYKAPLCKSMIGLSVGDTFVLHALSGDKEFEILEIF